MRKKDNIDLLIMHFKSIRNLLSPNDYYRVKEYQKEMKSCPFSKKASKSSMNEEKVNIENEIML